VRPRVRSTQMAHTGCLAGTPRALYKLRIVIGPERMAAPCNETRAERAAVETDSGSEGTGCHAKCSGCKCHSHDASIGVVMAASPGAPQMRSRRSAGEEATGRRPGRATQANENARRSARCAPPTASMCRMLDESNVIHTARQLTCICPDHQNAGNPRTEPTAPPSPPPASARNPAARPIKH
jgi:hypothetical protein